MLLMRQRGETLETIGARFGITRERVRQIGKSAGGPNGEQIRSQRRSEQERMMVKYLINHPGATRDEARAAVGTASLIRSDRVRKVLVRRATAKAIFEDRVVEALLYKIYRMLDGKALTSSRYDKMRIEHGLQGPTSIRIYQRYGSWLNALQKAGVPVHEEQVRIHRTRAYRPRFNREDIIGHAVAFLATDGHRGTWADFCDYLASYPGSPSPTTCRTRAGTWAEIKSEALRRMTRAAPEPRDASA